MSASRGPPLSARAPGAARLPRLRLPVSQRAFGARELRVPRPARRMRLSLPRCPPRRWHCFVGRKFSCYVSYEDGKFIYFYLGQMGVVVFAS